MNNNYTTIFTENLIKSVKKYSIFNITFFLFFFFFNTSNLTAQSTGAKFYIKNLNPWGQIHNNIALDNNFGSGNWTSANSSTTPSTIFNASTCFVIIEGSDGNSYFPAYFNANQVLIENWVSNGGRLFINAAPNYAGSVINAGFGSTNINNSQFSGSVNLTSAGISLINSGPNTPVAVSYSGSSFAHATISGIGLTSLINEIGGASVLAYKYWGNGIVVFGGMTAPQFQSPNPQAQNNLNNIINFISQPTINTSANLSSFSTCAGTVSTEQSFTVGGTFLTDTLFVTAPTGFEISKTSGSGFTNIIKLVPSAAVVATTTIYTRLTNSASGSPSGNITCISTGATANNIAVAGIANALPTFTATKTSYNGADLTCFGASNGEITFTNVTGGSPFQYSKNNGTSFQAGNVFAGLPENPYTVLVKDNNGCISTNAVVTISSPTVISGNVTNNGPVCTKNSLTLNGTIIGGTGILTYSWVGPNGYISDTTNSIARMVSINSTLPMNGLYTLQAHDENNCIYVVATNAVIKPSPILVSNASPVTNTICEGTSTTINCTNGATTTNPAVYNTAYTNTFSTSIDSNWTFPAIVPANVPTVQAYDGGQVLGYLSNQQAIFNLASLPTHDSILVDFDLYIHDTWDGNSTVSGPDMWSMKVDGVSYINTTFSNETWNSTTQSYPNNFSANNPSFTNAVTRTLPTACNFGGGSLSAKYHITKKIAHSASTLAMILEASGLENICNESWSIDNFVVQYRSQTSNSNITWTNPAVTNNSITVSPIVNTYYIATLDGCSDSIEIIVNPTPRANFSINTVNQCVVGNSYNYTNLSTLAGGGAMTYAWTMNGGAVTSATSQNVLGNTYNNHGSYNVRLVATSVIGNCSDSRGKKTKAIEVSPDARITQSVPNPICVGSTVRLTANQVIGGSNSLVYSSAYNNDFETSIGSAWTFPAIVPANVPAIIPYNGTNILGSLTNQKAIYNQTGLAAHDFIKIEFDLYLHDSWDGNSTDIIAGDLIGQDIWKMSVDGSNLINTTFSNFSYRTQAYPNNLPNVNLNGTNAVSNSLPTLCNHNGGALSSVYHISKTIPHTASSISMELEALGLESLCNESWSIDNLNIQTGTNTPSETLLSSCAGLGNAGGGPVTYTLNSSNDFQTSVGSAWSFPSISPPNEPTLQAYNGDSVLGFLTNQQAVYNQTGLTAHDYVKVEFDLYIYDTWDGNDISTGMDKWKMDIDGSNLINTTFSNFSYRTQAYPGNMPAINPNFTGAALSNLPARCNLGGGAPSSLYHISKMVPHTGSSINIVLEALGLEELCNESWAIDNFKLYTGIGAGVPSAATWNGGTATGETTCYVDVTPATSTSYTTTIGACTSPSVTLDVRPVPTPAFTLSNGTCSKTVSFVNTNIEADMDYVWNFGDGSPTYRGTNAPTHTYINGEYTITLTASLGTSCSRATTRTIKIADMPTAAFAFTGGTGCGSTVQFTNTSIAINTPAYMWNFGETPVASTSTDESPVHTFIADGNYSVQLTVTTGTTCMASTTASVTTVAAITGNQAIFTATIGSSCGNLLTTTNSSTGINNQYLWNFGDGNTSNEETPSHYYVDGGLKTVTLSILNGTGCATTVSKIVTVSNNDGTNGRIGVDFTVSPTASQVLLANDFAFEPTFVNMPNNNPVVYCAGAPTWTYGDGTGSTNTIIYSKSYAAAGSYTVRILQQTTHTGCFGEATKIVTVLPNPLMSTNPNLFSDRNAIGVAAGYATTGVNQIVTAPDFTMFPNPNKGSFKVQVTNLTSNGTLVIVDVLGREVATLPYQVSGNDIIEINNLAMKSGTYYLVLNTNNNVQVRKQFVVISE